jgi:tRNA (guanine37-N1)-methyltransferase
MVVYHLRGYLSNTPEPLIRFFTQGLQVCRAQNELPQARPCATIFAMNTTARAYLLRDFNKNIDMLEILPLPTARVLAASDSGVLLEHNGLYLLSCGEGLDEAYLPRLVDGLAGDPERMIVLHSPALKDELVTTYGFQAFLDVRHGVYRKKESVAYALPDGAQIRRLDESHLDFVLQHYHMMDDETYLRERIDEGMYGVFVGGELAGFIGTHDERSIGLLEILPGYRRLGLAFALEAHLINRLLEQGRIPFCQVGIDNEPSLALQRKLGMEISNATVHWLVRGSVR